MRKKDRVPPRSSFLLPGPKSGRTALLILVLATLGSCADSDAPLERGPSSEADLQVHLTDCRNSDRLHELICELVPRGALRHDALESYNRIIHLRAQGRKGMAKEEAGRLIAFLLENEDRINPANSKTAELNRVIRSLALTVGLPPPDLNEEAQDQGIVAMVGPGGGTFVAENGRASVQFQPGDLPEDVLLVATPFPRDAAPGNIDRPQFPFAFDLETFPSAEFNNPVRVGLCVVAPNAVIGRVQLFHNFTTGGGEVLEEAAPPPGLDCAAGGGGSAAETAGAGRGANGLSTAGGKDGGTSGLALAGRRGVGGLVSSFTAIVPFDPGEVEGTPPDVTDVDFPSRISNAPGSGFDNVGTVHFTDPDADIVLVRFIALSGPASGGEFDPGVFGESEGSFQFLFGCFAETPCGTGRVTLAVVLEDAAGNLSEPFEFSFRQGDDSESDQVGAEERGAAPLGSVRRR